MKTYLIEARKNSLAFFEVFDNLEEAIETLKALTDDGYLVTIHLP